MLTYNLNYLIIFLFILTALLLITLLNNLLLIVTIFLGCIFMLTLFLLFSGLQLIGYFFLIIYGGGVIVLYFIVIQFNTLLNYTYIKHDLTISITPISLLILLINPTYYYYKNDYKEVNLQSIEYSYNNYNINQLLHNFSGNNGLILITLSLVLLITIYSIIKILKISYNR